MVANLFVLVSFASLAGLLYVVHRGYRQKMIGFVPAVMITVAASVAVVYTVAAIYISVPKYAIAR